MQTRPNNWETLFNGAHKTEYKYVIGGVDYYGDNVKGTPTITKPLLEKPAIGRTCTGSLSLNIYPQGEISKAATVDAYCRLTSTDGETVTDWVPQGKFYVSSRSGTNILTLNCLDRMILAGQTYLDKTAFTEWPQSMQAVVNEIAEIMHVSIDNRTNINSGRRYVVDYPNEDMLMSEVLGMIAAAHGGNWIMTERGELRLVVLAKPLATATQDIGKTHGGFVYKGKTQTVSRVILVDDADNDFAAGDDTGLTISAECNYATQEVANTLCNGTGSVLYGVTYEPYELDKAYLDPCMELGDTLSFSQRDGTVHKVVLQTVILNCTVACTAKATAAVENETDDEFPYMTARDLSLSRTVKTNQTYFGNRITRAEGFVSELVVNDTVLARLTANASLFKMQSYDASTGWKDCIYFDTAAKKYVISADVTINGLVTFQSQIEQEIDDSASNVKSSIKSDLSTAGKTTITGGNITTGTIDASVVNVTNINANNIKSGTISADLIDTTDLKLYTLYPKVGTQVYPVIAGGGGDLYIGSDGSSSLGSSHLRLYATYDVYIGNDHNGVSGLAILTNTHAIVPNGTSSWSLGTSSTQWGAIYCGAISASSLSTGTGSISGGALSGSSLSVTGNITAGNVSASNGTISAYSLSVSNNISASSLSVSSISGLSSLSVSGTISANTLSASSLTGLSSLSLSGTLSAGTVSCSGTVSASTVSTTNITANGSDCRILGTVRIGGSGGSIGFFGHSPQSRETYSYKSTSAIKNDTGGALVELVNCMLHLGLITV